MADAAAALARLTFVLALWSQGLAAAGRPKQLLATLMALWVARRLDTRLAPRSLAALGLGTGAACLALPASEQLSCALLWLLWAAALFAVGQRPLAPAAVPGGLNFGERLGASLAVATLLAFLLLPALVPSRRHEAHAADAEDADPDRCEADEGEEDEEDEGEELQDPPPAPGRRPAGHLFVKMAKSFNLGRWMLPTPARFDRRLLLLATLLVLGGAIGGYLIYAARFEGTDDAQVEADVVPLSLRVAGQVLTVRVQDNQPVKAGDVLVDLDDAELQARLQQAEAELQTARAQAEAAQAQAVVVEATAKGGYQSAKATMSGVANAVNGANAQVIGARAAQERARAEAHQANADLARAKSLREANAIPEERLERTQNSAEAAQAALSQAEAQLAAAQEAKSVAESHVGEAQGRLGASAPIAAQIAAAQAQAQVAQAAANAAQARLAVQRLLLSYAHLIAPSDGVVTRLTAHPGQLLQPGQAVAVLVPSHSYVVANFKETQIGSMHPGQRVEIEVDAFPGRALSGRVESVAGGTGSRFALLPPDNASGNFVKVVQRVPVRIAWDALPHDVTMRAGLSVEVRVDLRSGPTS